MKKSVKHCMTRKMKKVMKEYKMHKLSMRGGHKVSKRKQAIAIGMSEGRQKCLKK
jgi:hypothetical protein